MTRRISMLLALAALVALAVAPAGFAGSKTGANKGYKLSRGNATVTLDEGLATALEGVTITALRPATAVDGADTPTFSFPVANGRAIVDDTGAPVSAAIKLVGGLKLTKDDKAVRVRNPRVTWKDGTGQVTVQLVGGKRFVLATIEGGEAGDVTISGNRHRTVTASGAKLTLDPTAAGALATVFGLDADALAGGTATASLQTRIVGKWPKGAKATKRRAGTKKHAHARKHGGKVTVKPAHRHAKRTAATGKAAR
jgi:hypothetical protein